MKGLEKPRRYFAIFAISCGTALMVMDGALPNVALPTIAREMNIDSSSAIMIVSVYQLAKAAANTAVLEGIAAEDFRRDYWPACRSIAIDNQLGKLVFAISHLIQTSRFYRRGILHMTLREQEQTAGVRHMSSVLWDIFTGSAPYREVIWRSLHPAFIAGLFWSLIAGNWSPGKNGRATWKPHG